MNASLGLQRLIDAVIVAVIRAPDEASALRGVEALRAGNVTGIEITYSTPSAAEVIATLRNRYGDDLVLGAGTVLHADQATEAAAAGASFLVSPGYDDELAAAMLAARTSGVAIKEGTPLRPTDRPPLPPG